MAFGEEDLHRKDSLDLLIGSELGYTVFNCFPDVIFDDQIFFGGVYDSTTGT